MAWLLRDAEVLSSLEIADSRAARAKGLLGRTEIEGAILLKPARSVHTIGMRFDIDVAHCDAEMTVVRVTMMPRNRVGLPVRGAEMVLEAEAGSFERWGLAPGDQLDIRLTS